MAQLTAGLLSLQARRLKLHVRRHLRVDPAIGNRLPDDEKVPEESCRDEQQKNRREDAAALFHGRHFAARSRIRRRMRS